MSRKGKIVECPKCGKEVWSAGLGSHMRIHKYNAKGLKKFLKKTDSGETDTKILKVPCDLGGHRFAVKVVLKIMSTTIVDG